MSIITIINWLQLSFFKKKTSDTHSYTISDSLWLKFEGISTDQAKRTTLL